ncbi:vomeronasal type-2 receptor 26-like [Pleurodeles waltl]|uniref:vomeronasal type-2 receptor 26-like n=1 Tax=Pleurodeles waltl TaxID=8319 RepID=UPI0037094AA7
MAKDSELLRGSALLEQKELRQVPQSVCSVSCTPGFHKVLREGQPACCYDCVPCADGEITNGTDLSVCLKCGEDAWSNEVKNMCIPRAIDFLSYEEPMGATLASISAVLSLLTLIILCIFSIHRDTPIVRANNRDLSYLLLVSLMLCFLCPFLFIGRPSRWTCLLRQITFGLVFSLSISCILAKTLTVIVAFKATKPNSSLKKWFGTRTSIYLIIFCTMFQLIICTMWLSTKPPYSGVNASSSLKIIIQCYEGSVLLFCFMLGYMGFLAGFSFILAFLSRNLPDSFNEARHITFSLLVFVSVWLSFIPAYLSTQGKNMVSVEVFAILASSSGLLACIFLPKVYIILLRPDMNSKSYLLNKK